MSFLQCTPKPLAAYYPTHKLIAYQCSTFTACLQATGVVNIILKFIKIIMWAILLLVFHWFILYKRFCLVKSCFKGLRRLLYTRCTSAAVNIIIFQCNSLYNLQEYIAVGEAPVELSNCFRQRSRWAKGPFQMLFRKDTLFLSPGITLIQRLFFFTIPYNYFVSALSTPVLFLVPVVAMLSGYYPIYLNKETVLGLTVYYVL